MAKKYAGDVYYIAADAPNAAPTAAGTTISTTASSAAASQRCWRPAYYYCELSATTTSTIAGVNTDNDEWSPNDVIIRTEGETGPTAGSSPADADEHGQDTRARRERQSWSEKGSAEERWRTREVVMLVSIHLLYFIRNFLSFVSSSSCIIFIGMLNCCNGRNNLYWFQSGMQEVYK